MEGGEGCDVLWKDRKDRKDRKDGKDGKDGKGVGALRVGRAQRRENALVVGRFGEGGRGALE